jgi:hypothetical protein
MAEYVLFVRNYLGVEGVIKPISNPQAREASNIGYLKMFTL